MRLRPGGLRERTILYGAVTVALALALVFYLDFKAVEREVKETLRQHMLEVATLLRGTVEGLGDVEAVQEALEALHQASPEAVHEVLLVDQEGVVLVSTRREDVGLPVEEAMEHPEPDMRAVLLGESPFGFEEMTHRGERVLDLWLPVYGDPEAPGRVTGALHYVEPYTKYRALVRRSMVRYSWVLPVFLVIVVVPLLLFLSRSILGPIRRIVASNRAVAEGRREAMYIPEEAIPDHELGEIMRTRNQMLAQLRSAEEELERKVKELSALHTVAETVSRSLDLEEVLNTGLGKTMEVLGLEAGGVYLMEPDGSLRLRLHRGVSASFVQAVDRIKAGEEISGQAVAQRRPVALSLSQYPTARLAPILREEGLESIASAPLMSGGEVLGALTMGSREPRFLSQAELDLLASIGDQIGMAVDNARHHQQLKAQRIQEQAALLELSGELLATLDVQEVMDRALEAVAGLLRVDICSVLLPDQTGRWLVLRAAKGWPPELVGTARVGVDDRASQVGFTMLEKKPVVVEDFATEGRFAMPAHFYERGIVSGMSVPMLVKGEVIGVMGAHTRTNRRFGEEEVRVFSLIANQTAVALERARLYQETKRRQEELAAQSAIAATVSRSLDLEHILNDVIDEVLRLEPFKGEKGAKILLLDEQAQELRLAAYRRVPPEHPCLNNPIEVGECLCGLAAQQGEVISGIAWDDGRHTRRWPEMLPHKDVCIPLKVKGKVLGVLNVWIPPDGQVTEEDIQLLNTIGEQVGVAVENAKLYGDLKARMEELQRTQEQLIQAERLAALGQMGAKIAHEINNPLSIVIGRAQLEARRTEDEQAKRRFEQIAQAGKRISKIAEGYVDLAKPRSPERKPLRLGEVIEETLEFLAMTGDIT